MSGPAPALWSDRLKRVWPALACPRCHDHLTVSDAGVTCSVCAKIFPYRHGKLFFVEPIKSEDGSGALKEAIKRFFGNTFYRVILPLFGPTFPFSFRRAVFHEGDPSRVLMVDVGCGNHRLDKNVIALDGADYPCTDIVADVTALPFKDNSIDVIASRSLLEHVWPLHTAISEMKRVTVPGGANVHMIPFIFPFHSSPHDFQRLTHKGAAAFFSDWTMTAQYHVFGPFTLLLMVVSESLAILLSFGLKWLRVVLGLLFCAILSPMKFLDLPFLYISDFITLAPSILTVARKPMNGK